jgi:DHA1 family bicyclomycin/chloramphenicol resistance-like MFS transporter
MIVALGPFALDTYLPAFPAIAADLGVAHGAVGTTLSAYVAVFGVGQLIGGPLSDRYGRRAVLGAGLALFAFASAGAAMAGSLQTLIGWRTVQALGGAWCAVSVPAMVRDRTRGNDAARLFALIGLVMFVAPALAPAIGSLLLWAATWRAIFVLLAAYAIGLAAVLYLALLRHLPPPAGPRPPLRRLVTNYLRVLRCGVALRFIGIQGLAFSTLLVFLTHASFMYQGWYGVSNAVFSALFAANIGAMATLNLVNRRLLRIFASARVLRGAIGVQAGAVAVLLVLVALQAPLEAVVPAIVVAVGCMGAIVPNTMANVLEFFPDLGATAAALLGAFQFACAGTISGASTLVADGGLVPIVAVMALPVAGALALALGAPAAMHRASLSLRETP